MPDVCSESISRPIRNFDIITDGLLTPFEGLYQQVTCKMKLTDNETCNDAFRELINSTKIYAHHKDNKENFADHAVVRATKTITVTENEFHSLRIGSLFEAFEIHVIMPINADGYAIVP